jgi:hypothetical protein
VIELGLLRDVVPFEGLVDLIGVHGVDDLGGHPAVGGPPTPYPGRVDPKTTPPRSLLIVR